MGSESLLDWHDVVREYAGFVALFLMAGAIGFRWVVVRGSPAAGADELRVRARALARAAMYGLIGAAGAAVLLALALPGMAERQHATIPEMLAHSRPVMVQVMLAVLALIGFALATARVGAGWPLATLGWLLGMVRAAFFGQWSRLVNPLHEVGAGLWIGTLFVLVAVGLPTVLRSELASERRGTVAAGMIHAFSPFALGSAALLSVFGVITAVRHLKRLVALWTTPYGWTFIAKLAVVALVAGLGAYHWRRVRPRLGTESAALQLQHSGWREVVAAAVVLALTAVLVSLPSPKFPAP